MTPHFQHSVVAAQLLPPLATAGLVGPPVWPPHAHYLPIVIPGSVGAGQMGGHAGLEEKPPPLLSGDYRLNYRPPLNLDTHGAPVAHIVDKTQSLAVHPVAGEVLLWAETADLDSATFSETSLAAASAALAAVASVAAAAPVAAAFVVLTSGVQQCLQFDLQVQPAAAPGPGLLCQMALASARLYCVRGAAACPLMRGHESPGAGADGVASTVTELS